MAALLLGSMPARADLVVTGSGTSGAGDPISATADFNFSGNVLTVVLTSNDAASHNPDVLMGLVFNNAPSPASTLPSSAGSAALTAGSSLVSSGTVASYTVGQKWEYLTTTTYTGQGGFGASGNGGFGGGNLCGTAGCGATLATPKYGIVGNGTNMSNFNSNNTFIKNSATFTVTLLNNSGFKLADINKVTFIYGTSQTGDVSIGCTDGTSCTFTNNVPEPSSLLILVPALAGLPLIRRRRKRA